MRGGGRRETKWGGVGTKGRWRISLSYDEGGPLNPPVAALKRGLGVTREIFD